MKYMYISITIATLVFATQVIGSSLFLRANDSGWYPYFLKPVVDTITNFEQKGKILDIGTGPGKLPELMAQQNSKIQITGIDIDTGYIDLARKRNKHQNIVFDYQQVNKPIPYSNEQFDVVCFCSVLFFLEDSTRSFLMQEAVRVLKPGGKIVILTPSGKKSIFTSFSEVWSFPFSKNNWTYMVWITVTSKRGQQWQKSKWLENYSKMNQFEYSHHLVFNNNASLEILTK